MAAGTTAQSIKLTVTQTDGEVFTNNISTKTITHGAESLPTNKTDQLLGTSYETIAMGDVSGSYKYGVCIRNMDAAITLYVSFNASTDHIEIEPGELAAFNVKGGVTVSIKGASGTPYAHVLVSQLKNA